ncbi:MAG TPA: PIG-L family deacetylase [Rhizobiaceae bacterium]|nr:PIG-L family deacetylase [Rhizobiaceae bacterium]
MLTDRERIERQRTSPPLLRLHRALSRLTSTMTVMNTGAHPDDEQSGLLSYFRLGLGMRVIIACSTRGEGGQNSLGPERLGALGALRTREMEEAARTLDADVVWLGHGPDDPVHDFGFSKDGDQTFQRWGETRIVERLVRAYRKERPDIVIPTFLDVPGQHGHHRAMTRAAETAVGLAADPAAFPEHLAEGLRPWRVAKFYLPAWSGGGGTYDDEIPPPGTTVTVEASGREPFTGAEYDRVGEWSRYYHASQGMGHWPAVAENRWPLHLKLAGNMSGAEASILDGLPQSLDALAKAADGNVARSLAEADALVRKAVAAFPDKSAIIEHLTQAAKQLAAAKAAAYADFLDRHGHRIDRKIWEVDAALLEAAGVFERAALTSATLAPGQSTTLVVELGSGTARYQTNAEPALPTGMTSLSHEASRNRVSFAITAADDAPFTGLYAPAWSALGGNGAASVRLSTMFDGHTAHARFDLDEPLSLVPSASVRTEPDAIIVPLDSNQREWPVDPGVEGDRGALSFTAGSGWSVASDGRHIRAPERLSPGMTIITPLIDGRPASRIVPIAYPHVGRIVYRQPEALRVLSLDLKLPRGRVGYVGGGADRVGLWLSRMGIETVDLDAKALAGDLSDYTAIVVGIFAFGIRKDLAAATPRLHKFVEKGGHLVTLYHRPTDGWDPQNTPPSRLEVGSPSLRWRVTDPDAEVTVLAPSHPLLTGPNPIGPHDWNGWDKERGLYFAARWDPAYEPLVSMHDPNEQPLKGALVSARIGKGRHTHTTLVLHHQLDKLVPGAFRLMANLVQPA